MTGARVGVDGRPLVGNRTGIGVHTAEIASRLHFEVPVVIASHREIEDRSGLERCRLVVDHSPLGVLWQQATLPRVMLREGCDVLWAPHATLPLSLAIPSVASVHDLTSISMPHRHRLKTIFSFNVFIRASLENASRIAAVSRVAADEVIRGFGINPMRIEIVPNGVDPFFSPGDEGRDDFVLYAGTLEPRKGIADLLAAWRLLGRRPRLVLAGDAGWGTSPLLRRDKESIDAGRLEIRGFVSRSELRDLYRRCAVFVYPSHFEGFGLPPLEAMACGAPVITTTGGAIPEVVGDAAELVRPGSPDELARALRRLAGSASRRSALREAGFARASRFSWENSASRMSELLVAAALSSPG